jgi:regulator of CtrA degradation
MDLSEHQLTPRVIAALYTEAMVLADEARSYFTADRTEQVRMGQIGSAHVTGTMVDAVAFSCESMKVTTRLMHCIAWLLNQRAAEEGRGDGASMRRGLGYTPPSDPELTSHLPDEARVLIAQSESLYARLIRLHATLEATRGGMEPARGNDNHPVGALMTRLQAAL